LQPAPHERVSQQRPASSAEVRDRGVITVGLAGHDSGPMARPGTIGCLFVVPPSPVQPIQAA